LLKRFKVLYVLASVSLVFVLFCGVVNALEQNEVIASVVLTNQNAYPGGALIVSIYLKSNSGDILTIQYVGIQFDWMSSDQFLGYDLSDQPVVISPYTDQFVDSITMFLPEDVTLGEHTYFVGIDGLEGTDQFTWDSQTFTLLVQDPKEQEYNTLLTQVSDNITASENKNYQSSTAKSLLTQAKTARDQALAYEDQNSWDDAITALNNAQTYLQQANAEEQNYLLEKTSQETMLITLGVIAVVIVVILAMIYIIIKNKNTKHEPVVDRAGIEPAAS
jgi:hypothetical protein